MLARKALLQFFSDNLVNFLGFISTFCIARFMGPSVLGTIGYGLSLLSLLSMFSDLGYSQAHIKRVSEGGDLKGKIGTFLSIRIILGIIFSVIAIIYLLFSDIKDSPSDLIIYFSFFVFYLTTNFSSLASATFQGLSKTSLNNAPIVTGRLIKTISVIIISLASMGTVWVTLTYPLDGIIAMVISLILLYKISGLVRPNLKYVKSYTLFAMPLAGLSIVSYLIGNADKIIINNYWNTKEVGLYFGIQSLMALPQSLSNALMTLLFPKFSELQKEKNTLGVKFHLKEAVRYLSIITVPIILISVFYNKEIPSIFFGSEYIESANIFIVASITVLIINLTRPYSNLLFALEKGKYMVLIGIVNLIVVLISDFTLIPKLKGLGAALGLFNMWLINASLTLFLVNKYYKIIIYEFIPKIIYSTILSIIILLLIKCLFPAGFLGFLLGIITFLMFYALTIYNFKLISKTDIKYFKEITSPFKMKDYIKTEMT